MIGKDPGKFCEADWLAVWHAPHRDQKHLSNVKELLNKSVPASLRSHACSTPWKVSCQHIIKSWFHKAITESVTSLICWEPGNSTACWGTDSSPHGVPQPPFQPINHYTWQKKPDYLLDIFQTNSVFFKKRWRCYTVHVPTNSPLQSILGILISSWYYCQKYHRYNKG